MTVEGERELFCSRVFASTRESANLPKEVRIFPGDCENERVHMCDNIIGLVKAYQRKCKNDRVGRYARYV